MPAVHLFRRRTIVGGDDLQPAAFVTALLRVAQVTFLLGPVFLHIGHESHRHGGLFRYMMYDPSEDENCRHSHLYATLLAAYAMASVVYASASMLLESRIAYWSSTGSPTDTEPRNTKIRGLLELKLVPFSILLFLVWMMGVSAFSFLPLYNYCYDLSQEELQGGGERDLSEALEMVSSFWNSIRVWWITITLLLMTQLAEVLVYWVFLWHLCRQSFPSRASGERDGLELTLTHELVEEMWADRCAAACQCLSVASCFMFGGRELLGQAEFGDIARALADYMETRGTLDVVPSDIVTGLVLIQRLQRQRLRRARMEVITQNSSALSEMERGECEDQSQPYESQRNELMVPLGPPSVRGRPVESSSRTSIYAMGSDGELQRRSRKILDRQSLDDRQVLEEGARYAQYALAIYTWVLYLYAHPCSGVPRLCFEASHQCFCNLRQRRRGEPLFNYNGRIEGDNLCETNKSSLLITAGLSNADLAYTQLRSGFSDTPYAILIDHEWESVVIAIRGTFSLEDCVKDVLINPEPLDQLGDEFGFDGTNQYCHSGVMSSAKNLYRDLQQHGLLDSLLGHSDASYPNYRLRIVGHSLGASIAALLSYMLRQKYPTLRCVNYSPAGHTLTWEMATGCHDWCSTFVLDSDLVPRLSLEAMESLRDEILSVIGRVRVPKIEVAKRLVRGSGLSSCHCFEVDMEDEEEFAEDVHQLLHDPGQIPDSDYQRKLDDYWQIQDQRRQSRGSFRDVTLFPPGKMVHLVKIGERRTCVHNLAKCLTLGASNAGSSYTPVWINNDDLNEIVVSPTMGADHFPNRISAALQAAASEFGVE